MILKSAATVGTEYDNVCKKLFTNKEIIAPILKYAVEEYKDCEISQIIQYINIEIQNRYKESGLYYPIEKRAIYYAARELSSQLGIITEETNYSTLQKSYSIWICNHNLPKELQNTISKFKITKEDVNCITVIKEANYDLLEVIMIRRGANPPEQGIFDYLDSIFHADIERMNKYIDVTGNQKIRKDVTNMTGLWYDIFEESYEKGEAEGIATGKEENRQLYRNVFHLFNNGKSSTEISTLLNISIEEVEDILSLTTA